MQTMGVDKYSGAEILVDGRQGVSLSPLIWDGLFPLNSGCLNYSSLLPFGFTVHDTGQKRIFLCMGCLRYCKWCSNDDNEGRCSSLLLALSTRPRFLFQRYFSLGSHCQYFFTPPPTAPGGSYRLTEG